MRTVWWSPSKAHPRECGDDPVTIARNVSELGSPPRMRGRRMARPSGSPKNRLTPANAGTTLRTRLISTLRWAHPRECGDDPIALATLTQTAGSPPRMRGRLGKILDPDPGGRLTPANAGTTSQLQAWGGAREAHPRECGDDSNGRIESGDKLGSPPRMRGRHRNHLFRLGGCRLTPANAGTTPAWSP